MTALLIALLHGVPVWLSALVFCTKSAVWVSASVMAVVAGFFGNPHFVVLDWIGVAIGALLGMMTLRTNAAQKKQ